MVSISIILPTNRVNSKLLPKLKLIENGFDYITSSFSTEFNKLIKNCCQDLNHYLQPTLESLQYQTFKDFELIISHRYPEESVDVLKDYNFKIKLIKEKHSIWHDLSDQYGSLCNNINTAVIHSTGKLLWRLDDLTFFNDNVLEEIWNNWKHEYYSTSRSIRCIEFNPNLKNKKEKTQIGKNKFKLVDNGWIGEYKPLTDGSIIPKWMSWGCSSSISIDDFLEVNGQDEVWDGSIDGTDMEFGSRVSRISKYDRAPTKHLIYELNDIPYKNMIRKDTEFRNIIGDYGTIANSWKPNEKHMRLYKEWHKRNRGDLDINWNKFLDVPYLDLKEEYNNKRLGDVLYEN